MDDTLAELDWKHLEERHHLQPGFMKIWVKPKLYKTLAEYIQATQDYQSELNRYYIDRLRFLKYRPNGGCVAFLLLDSNPAIQWSLIDYWREPKSSYSAFQKAMSPVYAFARFDRPRYRRGKIIRLPIYLVNDTDREVAEARVEIRVTDPVGNTALTDGTTVSLPADCEARAVMNPELLLQWEGEHRLEIKLSAGGQQLENTYRFQVS
jgi:beta-mannosidase